MGWEFETREFCRLLSACTHQSLVCLHYSEWCRWRTVFGVNCSEVRRCNVWKNITWRNGAIGDGWWVVRQRRPTQRRNRPSGVRRRADRCQLRRGGWTGKAATSQRFWITQLSRLRRDVDVVGVTSQYADLWTSSSLSSIAPTAASRTLAATRSRLWR